MKRLDYSTLLEIFKKGEYNKQRRLYDEAKSDYEKKAVITAYYRENEDKIRQLQAESNSLWLEVYPFDWLKIFTPIESYAWEEIRARGIVMYPQYPVLNYRVDFGNPFYRIGLELDGKEFHNKDVDTIRDQRIYDESKWKIYRVSGSEANRIINVPEFADEEDYEEKNIDRLFNTVEGVVIAIQEVYFSYYERDDERHAFYELCLQCLNKHKLANFNV